MNLFYVMLVLMSLTSFTVCSEDSTPIVVKLSSQSDRLPIHLSPFFSDKSEFDSSYIRQLEKVLHFDLEHNGITFVLTGKANGSFENPLLADDWKEMKAFYAIKSKVSGRNLSIRVFAKNSDTIKTIDDLVLSGNLSQDRKHMHLLADRIHKALFGIDGIASTKIIYTVKSAESNNDVKWRSEVWEADYDGENARQITNNSPYAITPVYVPPKPGFISGAFFYVSYKTGQPKIYYQLLNGGEPRRLSFLRGNQLMPALSRQRDKLAFISDVTGNPDLFIQPFSLEEGTVDKPYQIFATRQATQGTPSFHPDGKRIAFVSNKDGIPRIYAIDIPEPGSSLKDIKAQLITRYNRECTAPAWSPDGTKIAYCALTNGVRQIWVYDCTTKEEKQLTQGPGNKENPAWAPNSLHLVFNSSNAKSCDLYLINLNQTDMVKITKGSGEKRFPSWEPR